MARITLTNGFSIIPEGEYIFCVYGVEYDPEFGKLQIKLVTADGQTHIERYSLMKQDGTPNETAYSIFSYLAKTIMNDFSLEDVDPDDLVGKYLKAEIKHTELPSKKDPTKTSTFANLGDKSPADGFDKEPNARCMKVLNIDHVESEAMKSGLDLDSLLG